MPWTSLVKYTNKPRLGMTLRGCCPLSQGAEAFVEAHLQRVKLLRAQGRYNMCIYVHECTEDSKLQNERNILTSGGAG